MTSGLPVYWVPCFDGGAWQNGGRASFWRASHRDLLARASDPLKQYFIYALLKKTAPDPVAFLAEPVNPQDWAKVLAGTRNLWCCAVFTHVVDRTLVAEGGAWRSVPQGAVTSERPVSPFTFDKVMVSADPTGMALYPPRWPRFCVERFRVTDPATYAHAMTQLTAEMLSSSTPGAAL